MGQQRITCHLLAMCLALVGATASAADPFFITTRLVSQNSKVDSSRVASDSSPLDLRPPQLSAVSVSGPPSSSSHVPNFADSRGTSSSRFPMGRSAGAPEELAKRLRREGLPVARLFENQSALVSLGLNQKGKPGLWLIQKMR
jgi:hypothetical protein